MYYYIDECLNSLRRAESWQSNSNHYSQPVLVNEHILFLQGTENPDRCFPGGYSMDLWSVARMVKHLSAMQKTRVWFLGWEGTLEKEMATHSSILAWRIPWTEEPGRLHSPCSRKGRTRLSDQTTTTMYICVNVGYLFFSFWLTLIGIFWTSIFMFVQWA